MRLLPCVTLCAVLLTTAAAAAEKGPTGELRLRPQDSRLAQALKEGARRSATFKSLVDRIEASDVIVYVAINPTMKPNLAGMLTWMTQAGDYRYVRASIKTELSFDDMISTLAHELQHAVEVIDDPTVVDEKTLVALYQRIGRQHSMLMPARWETEAAQETAYRVRRELGGSPTTIARAHVGQV